MTFAFCKYKKVAYFRGMENNMKLRFSTKQDVQPTLKAGQSCEDFNKEHSNEYISLYGTIGYNITNHLLKASTCVINGERVIFSAWPTCGTSTKNRVTSVNLELGSQHIDCDKCLKKLNKGA